MTTTRDRETPAHEWAQESAQQLARKSTGTSAEKSAQDLAQEWTHELRQPLAAILSNAQTALRLLARGARATEDVREILEDIVASDKRAAVILRRLEEAQRSAATSGTRAGEPSGSGVLHAAQGE